MRPLLRAARHGDAPVMEPLQTMHQHRPVSLGKDIRPYLDDKIGPDADQVLIEGRMVELAERESVLHDGETERVGVRDDVSGVEQRLPLEAAERAALLVGTQYAYTERALVQALSRRDGDVLAPGVFCSLGDREQALAHVVRVVDGHMKAKRLGLVGHDVHGPGGEVLAFDDAVEVDQGPALLHGASEADVLVVLRILSAIAIEEERAVRREPVVVGSSAVRVRGGGRDRQGQQGQDGWFEDALEPLQADLLALEEETVPEQLRREYVSVEADLLCEEIERGEANAHVEVVAGHARILHGVFSARVEEAVDAIANDSCPFCQLPPERPFHQGPLTLGLWDNFPVSPGHALLIPRRHVPTWFDATPEEQQELTAAIELARAAILARHRPDGFNVGMNLGAAAGQTVEHLHLHVIPRYAGDVPDPRGGVRWVVPARADYWSK